MIRPRSLLLSAGLAVASWSCHGSSITSASLDGTYVLVEENGQALPSDPAAPFGCCVTLSGSITFTATTYDLRTTHRNKNTGVTFSNSEQGTYTREGSTLTFTRTHGGMPYLLGPGTISSDGRTVTLLYGDEGPGSDQIRATLRR
jgi:hypothetical protein